jgi:DMSO/TMAO reductase YedYZ molybdopterin-dependent catalytic subunit
MRHLTLILAFSAGLIALAPAAFAACAPAHATHADAPATGPSSLTVSGPSGSVTVSVADLAAMPHQTVGVVWHGKPASFSGVPLSDVLAKAGAPHGETLRGPALANVVVVTAADGYRIVLSLAETDPSLTGRKVLLADGMDGKPLEAADGPIRLVVEGDARPARSARMVAGVAVKTVP